MRTGLALLSPWLVLASIATAAGPPAAEFDLEVTFEFGSPGGGVGFREELELQLLSELRRAGCFRRVDIAASRKPQEITADRLLLRITVDRAFEETTFDVSTAQRVDPYAAPGLDLAHTSRFEGQIHAALEHPASARVLRVKRVRGSAAHRPRTEADDSRDAARREAIIEMIRNVRVFICKGGVARLRKEIAG